MDFLDQVYLSNTALQWLVSLAIIAASFVVAKALYWFFGNLVRRFTARTQNGFDDLLVDTIEKPIIFVVVLLGIRYGLGRLIMPDRLRAWLDLGVGFVLTLVVAWLAARFFDAVFRAYVAPLAARSQTDFDDQILPIARKATKAVIWIFGIVVALDNAGQDVGALLAGLGIGGLALAMAAKDTVSNIFGGFTIFADKPFMLNDRIRTAGFDGFVREVGLRSTRLQTLDGTIVTIPNSKFADAPVENISREPSRKVVVSLGLVYDTSPEQMQQAMETLQKICEEDEGVEKCIVFFGEFGDFSMNIKLIYYIKKEADIPATQNSVNMAILTRFNEQGLEFAFPTQTLYAKAEVRSSK